ncbi:MAG: Hint domain-containing protein [bacterium]
MTLALHDIAPGQTLPVRLATGLFASTPVQTAFGWQSLSLLGPGDLVMTQDHGLVPVQSIVLETRRALWSVRIAVGALGNCDALMLPPGQPILIHTRYARPFCGDDLALVPATALEGWRAIAPYVPVRREPILQVQLVEPGILFAGPGLMTGCDGTIRPGIDLASLLGAPIRPVLPLAAARQMIAHLIADEAGDGLRHLQAAAFRPPNRS